MTGPRRKGFTLVELLVVISIISMLMAMLLPAVQRARESGRRSNCMNNQRQLGLALTNYENTRGAYPGYANNLGDWEEVSWVVILTPYIERNDIWQSYQRRELVSVRMDLLICPSNPPQGDSGAPLGYTVNTGTRDNWKGAPDTRPRDYPANGIFHFRGIPFPAMTPDMKTRNDHRSDERPELGPSVSASWISSHDGVSTTILLSENVNAGNWTDSDEWLVGMTWTNLYELATERPVDTHITYQPNTNMGVGQPAGGYGKEDPERWLFARPSAFHPGGVIVTFADAHEKFVKEDINYITFCQLMTPWGIRSDSPTAEAPSNVSNGGGNDPFPTSLVHWAGRSHVPDESQY